MTADHRGCPLAYDLCGAGPNVLFIQGVGVGGGGWRPQVDGLADRYACLTFDNRGIGRSVPAAADVTVPQMAEDALAVMDAAGWASAHVVGHSLGGLAAVALALAARQRVKSLSLLCTFASGRAAAPLTARMIWFGLRSQVGTRRMRRRGFLKLVLPPGHVEDLDTMAEQLSELFGHDLADQPPVAKQQLRAMRACDLTPRLAELAGVPTLVVSAAHDPIAPPAVGRALLGIPGSRYVPFDDASHGLPITHADAVNALLHDHFAGVPPESCPVRPAERV